MQISARRSISSSYVYTLNVDVVDCMLNSICKLNKSYISSLKFVEIKAFSFDNSKTIIKSLFLFWLWSHSSIKSAFWSWISSIVKSSRAFSTLIFFEIVTILLDILRRFVLNLISHVIVWRFSSRLIFCVISQYKQV
jgi:hypothetical protein